MRNFCEFLILNPVLVPTEPEFFLLWQISMNFGMRSFHKDKFWTLSHFSVSRFHELVIKQAGRYISKYIMNQRQTRFDVQACLLANKLPKWDFIFSYVAYNLTLLQILS